MAEAAALTRELLYRDLVSPELWNRLVERIMKDEQLDRDLCEEITNEAIGFLKLYADHPGEGFSPSPMVDIGWHTFILYTRGYSEFCNRVAGRFIHHEPNDEPGKPSEARGPKATVSFMEQHGISHNPLLWLGAAGCGPGGSGCGTVDCDDGGGGGNADGPGCS